MPLVFGSLSKSTLEASYPPSCMLLSLTAIILQGTSAASRSVPTLSTTNIIDTISMTPSY